MKYLLDTDMCIYIIKRRPAKVLRKLQQLAITDIAVSCITLSELEYGAAKSQSPEQNRAALREFIGPIDVVSYDTHAARIYGSIKAHLERQGAPIGPMDFLIAAHAIAIDCILITNNDAEFKRVPGLRVQNWAK